MSKIFGERDMQHLQSTPSAYTVVHIGRKKVAPARTTKLPNASCRTSLVIVGLLFMFFLAVFVSWHSIQRVYSTLAAEVDEEEEIEVEVVDDGIKPPPLMTTAPTNTPQAGAFARDTATHGSASSTKLLSSNKKKPASSEKRAPKHYSHGMLQRVVEGVMKNVHRRKHHSQHQR